MEKEGNNSSARQEYLNFIFKMMRENEDFLHENSEDIYGEIVGLMTDAIDYRKEGIIAEDYVKYSIAYFLHHVLMPVGGAIYVNVLTGNLPACFMEIRLALESLVKCLFADLKYPGPGFFRDRLHLLEEDIRQENISISRLMIELDDHLGLKKDFIKLWGKLSDMWIHAKGIMDGIVDYVIEKSDVPPWGLVIPMKYTRNDLKTLTELGQRLAQFRHLLGVTIQAHRQRDG